MRSRTEEYRQCGVELLMFSIKWYEIKVAHLCCHFGKSTFKFPATQHLISFEGLLCIKISNELFSSHETFCKIFEVDNKIGSNEETCGCPGSLQTDIWQHWCKSEVRVKIFLLNKRLHFCLNTWVTEIPVKKHVCTHSSSNTYELCLLPEQLHSSYRRQWSWNWLKMAWICSRVSSWDSHSRWDVDDKTISVHLNQLNCLISLIFLRLSEQQSCEQSIGTLTSGFQWEEGVELLKIFSEN